MPTQIKFLYFDLGGVFFHWRQFLQTHPDFQAIFDQYDTPTCLGQLNPQELAFKYHLDPKLNFIDFYTNTFIKIPEMHKFALDISQRYPIGIITDLYKGMFEMFLQKDLIPNLPYSPIIESWKVGFRKPQKEIYDVSLAKSSYKLEEILFIDDNPINTEAAQNLGWNCVQFDEWHPEKSIEEIKDKLV